MVSKFAATPQIWKPQAIFFGSLLSSIHTAARFGGTAIKVKVYAPAFINHEPIGKDGLVTLADGATLHDLYRLLKIPVPLRFAFFCSVNYEPAKWSQPLQDGDTVTFLFPISGG